MGNEIELKFEVAPRELRKFKVVRYSRGRPPKEENLVSVYFDAASDAGGSFGLLAGERCFPTDRDLRKIPSRIASPSTNGPSMSTPEPRAATGRVTSSFVSEHGRCSFSMSANRA
jgi:hypothetical protein